MAKENEIIEEIVNPEKAVAEEVLDKEESIVETNNADTNVILYNISKDLIKIILDKSNSNIELTPEEKNLFNACRELTKKIDKTNNNYVCKKVTLTESASFVIDADSEETIESFVTQHSISEIEQILNIKLQRTSTENIEDSDDDKPLISLM